MYKVGDEVLIKAEITDVHEGCENAYFVAPKFGSYNWVSEDKFIPMDKTYADGLNDAWELAKKISLPASRGGLSCDEFAEIFGDIYTNDVFFNLTAEEAIAKIEAYEKEKEIRVGDVVRRNENGFNGVVTAIKHGEANVMYDDGSSSTWSVKNLIKTGKHIDIESLLRQIGE